MLYVERDYAAEAVLVLKELAVTCQLPVPDSDATSDRSAFQNADTAVALLNQASILCKNNIPVICDSGSMPDCHIPWEKAMCNELVSEELSSTFDCDDFDCLSLNSREDEDDFCCDKKLPECLTISHGDLPMVSWNDHPESFKEMAARVYTDFASLLDKNEFLAAISHSANVICDTVPPDWINNFLFHGEYIADGVDVEEMDTPDIYDACFESVSSIQDDNENEDKLKDLLLEVPITECHSNSDRSMPYCVQANEYSSNDLDEVIAENTISPSLLHDLVWKTWLATLNINDDEIVDSEDENLLIDEGSFTAAEEYLKMPENDALFLMNPVRKPLCQTILSEAAKIYSASAVNRENLLQRFCDSTYCTSIPASNELALHYALNNIDVDIAEQEDKEEQSVEALNDVYCDSFVLDSGDLVYLDVKEPEKLIKCPLSSNIVPTSKQIPSLEIPQPGLKFIPHIPEKGLSRVIAEKAQVPKVVPKRSQIDITFDIGDFGLSDVESKSTIETQQSAKSTYFDETWNNTDLDFMLQAESGSSNQTFFAPSRSVIRNKKRKY